MTPDDMRALAAESGSPALQALVCGHLDAGRAEMAAMALTLSPASVALLDAWFADAADKAYRAGGAAALAAMMDGEADGETIPPARRTGRAAEET